MKNVRPFPIILLTLGVTLLANMTQAADLLGVTAVGSPAAQSGAGSATTACPAAAGDPSDRCCQGALSTSFYADFLWLRPRNEGVEYAVPINGQIQQGTIPQQQGATEVVDPNFSAGFRIGVDTALSDCSSLFAEYTYYRNTTNDSVATSAPLVLRSMVLNPSTLDAAADFLNANASEIVDFDVIDLGYYHNFWACGHSNLGGFAGVRYGHLSQDFQANYSNIVTESVDTGVNFDGVGPRFGLDGNWQLPKGFFLHGKASVSLLGGEYRANYSDTSPTATATPIVATTWNEACLTSVVDGELGFGWQNCDGRIRFMAAYSISDWCNTVKPSDFIAGVQANNYRAANQLGQTALIFDGFAVRAEVNW